MKTADLTGALLDYHTARAEGVPSDQLGIRPVQRPDPRTPDTICVRKMAYRCGEPCADIRIDYSTNWALAGSLLEKHRIDLGSMVDPVRYQAEILVTPKEKGEAHYWALIDGDTRLIAICRAVVRAAFGDEVEDLPCA